MSDQRKTWLQFIGLAVAGLIGYGTLRSDVAHNTKDLGGKADRETVNVQYQNIIARLDDITRRLERMEAK